MGGGPLKNAEDVGFGGGKRATGLLFWYWVVELKVKVLVVWPGDEGGDAGWGREQLG